MTCTRLPFVLLLILAAARSRAAPQPVVMPYESAATPANQNSIDDLVFGHLRRLGIEAAHPCSDAVFVRRVYLDVIGTLPTGQEAKDFLADTRPDKRRILIDRLLERDEFADYWTMKWCDVLRVKSEFPINLWPNAVQAYQRWIHTALRQNEPYDRFARELLTASGSNFRDPPVNFWRAVQSKDSQGLAKAVALTFMGCRAERWPKEQLSGMAAFFSQVGYKSTAEWKEEIVYFDPNKPATRPAVFPDGTVAKLTSGRDPREVFADWLIDRNNPWFARAVVNRIWFWLLGRGIVHEPDDIRPDNPASNPALLALLERSLIANRYDLKQIYRQILNSRTYQLSSIPVGAESDAAANFACYSLRPLEAEVLIDAIDQITGSTEKYTSAIPEPYTFIPKEDRSITLADGSITSSFLELFGRPPRDTGLAVERLNSPTAEQRLHLLNSTHIQRKIEQSSKLRSLFQSSATQREKATALYLTILSRYPTENELTIIRSYAQRGDPRDRAAWADLTWALINCPEFLYRH